MLLTPKSNRQMISKNKEFSSFRDASGIVFRFEGSIYRTVNSVYRNHYDHFNSSGLSQALINKHLLVKYEETVFPGDITVEKDIYKVLRPEIIPFISYPYEWSFSQLKDAAVCTLNIQKTALEYNMSLKDASAYNIQFLDGTPILIDTLSFEKYAEGDPWRAYGQFCRHFLGPLLLASFVDPRLLVLSKEYIDGLPLDLVSNLMPLKAKANMLFFMHIYLQAHAKTYVSKNRVNETKIKIGKKQTLALIENLIEGISNLKPHSLLTTWGNYYNMTNYTDSSMSEKILLVSEWTKKLQPKLVWDLGGNNGKFCRDIKYSSGLFVCADSDVAAIEDCYIQTKQNKEKNILPLIIDITNPSGGIGWNNKERLSFLSRGPADLVFVLAFVHHLAIGNNLPLEYIRDYLSEVSKNLIIEFVPKEDSQAQKLLIMKNADFPEYTLENFEKVFAEKFILVKKTDLTGSKRVLFLMTKK